MPVSFETFNARVFAAAKSNAPSAATKPRALLIGSPMAIELDDQNACLPSAVFGAML